MKQRQQSLRYEAARAFMESLDQLQETLQPASALPVPPTVSEPEQHSRVEASLPDQFDLSSFEQAVADIEEFIQKRQGNDEGVGNRE